MLGRKLTVNKKPFINGIEVLVVDKIMTNMAEYTGNPIINNAPFEVYVGQILDDSIDGPPFIEFVVKDIIKTNN